MKLEEIENFNHSLMIYCRNCHIWGCSPNHEDGEVCGNCNSNETFAYYPITKSNLSKLLAVAKAARIFKNHICGLLAWSGKCNACNEFGAALEELEKG